MKRFLLILCTILLPACAFAEDHQFVNGEAVTLQPDRAYILVRTLRRPGGALRGTVSFGPILFRVLTDAELGQAESLAKSDPDHWVDQVESNVVRPSSAMPYLHGDDNEVILISLKPGAYILGGASVTNWATATGPGLTVASLCMGTVKFEAKPGVITDMGTMLNAPDDEATDIPELQKAVTGKAIGTEGTPETVAIRQAAPTGDLPAAIAALPHVAADYRAVPPFQNYMGAPLSRIAPLPGVIDYDKDGKVIDLKSTPAH
jgi:hypothetical protein